MVKYIAVLLCVLTSTTIAADLIVNGDFEAGYSGWLDFWGGNSDIGDHTADYGENPAVNNDAGIWWTDDGIYQDIAIGADIYTIDADLIKASSYPLTGGRRAVLKAIAGNAPGHYRWHEEIAIDSSDPLNTWVNGTVVIDNRTAGASNLRISLELVGSGGGNAYFDNISVDSAGISGSVSFTSVPAYGDQGNLSGIVSGVTYADYKVLVYINVSGWWNKPSWSSPEISINPDGSWTCDITTSGNDIYATDIIAFLVPNGSYGDYDLSPWRMSGGSSLPAELYAYPYNNVLRSPTGTIEFAGHDWTIKNEFNGPGPNFFSNSINNVWVDSSGYMHLKITNPSAGQWDCGEIISDESFGYGTYVFTVESRVDTLDENIVLGLFTWDTYAPGYNYREIDFEFSRWQDPAKDIGQYVIQPWYTPGNIYRFDIDYTGPTDITTHVMTWGTDGIYFKSYYGDFSLAPPPANIISDWYFTGADNPPPGGENVRMNLWLIDGDAPSDGLESEIVIKDFQFLTDVSHQAGDIDGDWDVNLADFVYISDSFQNINCDIYNNWCDRKDIDCNGSIGVEDVLALCQYWLESWN